MLVVEELNARVWTYQNVKVDNNVMVSDLTCDLEDCNIFIVVSFSYACLNAQTQRFSMVPTHSQAQML